MWTRRTPDEIAQIERRKRRQRFSPLPAALITLVLMSICFIVGPSYWRSLLISPRLLVLLLLVFGSFYLSRILVGRYWLFGPGRDSIAFPVGIERNKICPVCHTIHFTGSDVCPCGDRLEDLEHWKYVAHRSTLSRCAVRLLSWWPAGLCRVMWRIPQSFRPFPGRSEICKNNYTSPLP
jgi:hypothetical protein